MEHQPVNVIAVIPMKPLAKSKTRLARRFTQEQRGDLALGMLHQVLMALRAVPIDIFWVVGGDGRVRDLTQSIR